MVRYTSLTGFQRDALFTIAELEHPHGLAIKQALETEYETEINHGRLYPNLDDLADLDLIEIGEKDGRTNQYALTDRGRDLLRSRLAWEQDRV